MTTATMTQRDDLGFPPMKSLAEVKIDVLLARAGGLALLASDRICLDRAKKKERQQEAANLIAKAIRVAWKWPGLEFPTMRRIERIQGVLNR